MINTIDVMEMKSKVDSILQVVETLQVKSNEEKIYDTKSLCQYLNVSKATINKLRMDGELAYAKLGRTIIYTQTDVDELIRRNHINFVA